MHPTRIHYGLYTYLLHVQFSSLFLVQLLFFAKRREFICSSSSEQFSPGLGLSHFLNLILGCFSDGFKPFRKMFRTASIFH